MPENIDEMRERHKQEIADLQEQCAHGDVDDWATLYWAVGHSTLYEVRRCNVCAKDVEKRRRGHATYCECWECVGE